MMQRPPAPDSIRTALPACIILLLFSSVIAVGCLDNITNPDFSSFSFPRFTGSGGQLRAYFFDVGQGDSALIIFNNRTVLIDAGEVDRGDVVVQDLKLLSISRIDLLVATHPHSDHIGGMEKVLDAVAVGRALDAGMPHPSPLYERFLDTIEARHIPYAVARQGQTLDLDPALRILVLWPPDNPISEDLNGNSIVLRISYGTVNLLLAGDAGKAAEEKMLATGYALDSEILKVAHHGSPHSTTQAFLDRVRPEVAVIPVGADNPYGHPAEATLAALKQAGCAVYRTDRDGDILISSDGMSYTVQTSRGQGGAPLRITGAASLTPNPVTTAMPGSPAGAVVISATQFNAPGDDRGNLNGEYVRITNRGAGAVSLNGWTLADRTGSHVYVFPAFTLFADSSVYIYTGSGAINDTALYMGESTPLWGNTGDEAVLRDDRGHVVDRRSEGDTS